MKTVTIILLGLIVLIALFSYSTFEAKPKKKPNPCKGITSMAECPEIGCGGDSLLNRKKNA